LVVFAIIIILATSCNSWAYLLDRAKEYQIKAAKFQSEGKLDKAISYYQKAIGIDKHSLAAYNSLAVCYEKKGLLTRAENTYQDALKINFRYAPAHYNLGLFYEKYGDINKAIFHWRQRVRLGHPADPARLKARAKLEEYAPDVLQEEDAQELNRRIERQKEQNALDKITGRNKYKTKDEKLQEYYLQGMQAYEEGDFRGAQEHFQNMIEVLPVSN